MQAEHPAQTCRKRRETVFFDLDDTLYDRAVPYLAAFRQFFGSRYEDRAAQAFDAVIRRGYEVFKPAHTGQITMEQMHIYRHQTGLRDVGISVTPEQALQLQALYAAQQGAIRLTGTMQAVLTLCAARFPPSASSPTAACSRRRGSWKASAFRAGSSRGSSSSPTPSA